MKKRPSEVIRIGRVSGSIFENESDGRTFRSCSLQCRVAGKDGEEARYLSSFSLADIPAAQAVLAFALEKIAAAEANVELSPNDAP